MPGYTYQKWRDTDGTVKKRWSPPKHHRDHPDALSEEGRAKYARALALELDISRKAAIEIARTIRGWPLQDAIEYLQAVQRKEIHVPYHFHKRQVTHRRRKTFVGQTTGQVHRILGPSGRYPVLAAKQVERALRYAEAYAEERDLDTDWLRLEHIAAHLAETHTGWMPRAHGRATPKKRHRVNIEVVVREDDELAEKAQRAEALREE